MEFTAIHLFIIYLWTYYLFTSGERSTAIMSHWFVGKSSKKQLGVDIPLSIAIHLPLANRAWLQRFVWYVTCHCLDLNFRVQLRTSHDFFQNLSGAMGVKPQTSLPRRVRTEHGRDLFKRRISLPFLYSSVAASTPHGFSSWAKFAPRRPSPPPCYAAMVK